MKKKIIIATVCSVVILLAAIAAGLNAVYTVTSVRTDFTVFSEQGRADSALLQDELDGFVGKSSYFLDIGEVENTVRKYPCFRLEYARKNYPQTITVKVSEREETFVFAHRAGELEAETYAVLDADGEYLYHKDTNENRLDGARNVLLEGFSFSVNYHERAVGIYADELFAVTAVFREAFGNMRMNVVSVKLVTPSDNREDDYFVISMREGVTAELHNPSSRPEEKAQKMVEKYRSLENEDVMFGKIVVSERTEVTVDPETGEIVEQKGEVFADYTPRELPAD